MKDIGTTIIKTLILVCVVQSLGVCQNTIGLTAHTLGYTIRYGSPYARKLYHTSDTRYRQSIPTTTDHSKM